VQTYKLSLSKIIHREVREAQAAVEAELRARAVVPAESGTNTSCTLVPVCVRARGSEARLLCVRAGELGVEALVIHCTGNQDALRCGVVIGAVCPLVSVLR
jgi:hypothetical protein